jgi:hypothetical protein
MSAAALFIAASPCLAQMGGPMAGGGGVGGMGRTGPGAVKPLPAPPVLPGTKPASVVAEPTAKAADMSPTEGLFDAVNRGDLAAARDAVNRGANLDSVNLLGLTPVDLSVDLGRNDITFMLLSMRGDDPSRRRSSQSEPGSHDATPPPARQVTRIRAATPAAADDADLPAAATPRLFSGNGGAPIPAAGFLGFDSGRSGH